MVTVGPSGNIFWDYPAEQEPNVDRFKVYIDGEQKAETEPSARSIPISAVVTAPGSYNAEVSAENAMGEGPKGSVDFRLVTGVPIAPSNVRVG